MPECMSHLIRLIFPLIVLISLSACTQKNKAAADTSDPDTAQSQASEASEDEVAALPKLEPAKLPPAEKPAAPEPFKPAKENKEIVLPVSLPLPPEAMVEKAGDGLPNYWIRAYKDDYFLEVGETDYTWESLMAAIETDETYTFRQVLMTYESTALVEVSVDERLQYIAVAVLPGADEASYLVRSKPGQVFSEWGAQQMYRTLRLTARNLFSDRSS